MDLCIGSSNNRSKQQQEHGKKTITAQIDKCNSDDFLLFTDGSAIPNPGPTGSAVVILEHGPMSTPITIGKPVSNHSDNIHGEIIAILLVTQHAKAFITSSHKSARFFIDCRSAIQAITSNSVASNHHTSINQIKRNLLLLQELHHVSIHFHWTPGHSGIDIHDMVDLAAKSYAVQAQNLPSENSSLVTVAKARISNSNVTRFLWERRWEICPVADYYKMYVTDLSHSLEISNISQLQANMQKSLIKLRINHTKLPAHKSRYSKDVSPLCDVCNSRFNTEHLFFHCIKFEIYRTHLLSLVRRTLENDQAATECNPSISTLLGLNKKISQRSRVVICNLVVDFLSNIAVQI